MAASRAVEMLPLFVIVAAALIALVWWAVKARVKRLLGPIELEIEPQRPLAGDCVDVVARLAPTGRIRVDRITLAFRAYEWIRWETTESYTDSEGKSQTRTVTHTQTHFLFDDELELDLHRALRPGELLEHRARWEIPHDAPPSIDSPNNRLVYEVVVHVDVPNLPDRQNRPTC